MRKSSETSVCDPHSRCESLVLNPGALLRNTCLSLCLDLSFRRPGSQNVLLPGSGEGSQARLQAKDPKPAAGAGVRGRSPRNDSDTAERRKSSVQSWLRWLVQSLLAGSELAVLQVSSRLFAFSSDPPVSQFRSMLLSLHCWVQLSLSLMLDL